MVDLSNYLNSLKRLNNVFKVRKNFDYFEAEVIFHAIINILTNNSSVMNGQEEFNLCKLIQTSLKKNGIEATKKYIESILNEKEYITEVVSDINITRDILVDILKNNYLDLQLYRFSYNKGVNILTKLFTEKVAYPFYSSSLFLALFLNEPDEYIDEVVNLIKSVFMSNFSYEGFYLLKCFSRPTIRSNTLSDRVIISGSFESSDTGCSLLDSINLIPQIRKAILIDLFYIFLSTNFETIVRKRFCNFNQTDLTADEIIEGVKKIIQISQNGLFGDKERITQWIGKTLNDEFLIELTESTFNIIQTDINHFKLNEVRLDSESIKTRVGILLDSVFNLNIDEFTQFKLFLEGI